MKTLSLSLSLILLCLTGCAFRMVTIHDTYLKIISEVEQEYDIKMVRRDFVYLEDSEFDALCDKYYLAGNTKAVHLWFLNITACRTYVKASFCRHAGYYEIRELIEHELLHCLNRCHKIGNRQRQMINEYFIDTGFGEEH